MSTSTITKLRRKRTLKRIALNRALDDVNKLLEGDHDFNEARCGGVNEVLPQIKTLDEEIDDLKSTRMKLPKLIVRTQWIFFNENEGYG